MENGEINRIYDWSIQHEGCYNYSQIDKTTKSYFVLHDGDTYIKEYGDGNTIAEVKTELEQMWSGDTCMEKIIMPVAVAMMKGMPNVWKAKTGVKKLDDFIYIF